MASNRLTFPDSSFGQGRCLHAASLQLITADAFRMACLEAAASIALPDWYIAAGFVRNLIWDHVHGYSLATPLSDVDLVYFDPYDLSPQREQVCEAVLARLVPDARWQVRNQARMHLRNGHVSYRDTLDAISHFPELETGIGVRWSAQGGLQLGAPHRLACNWALTVSPNPKNSDACVLTPIRAADKGWLHTWPRLRLLC